MSDPTREREALLIAYRELKQISQIAGFKKSTAPVLAAILALVPELRDEDGEAERLALQEIREGGKP